MIRLADGPYMIQFARRTLNYLIRRWTVYDSVCLNEAKLFASQTDII